MRYPRLLVLGVLALVLSQYSGERGVDAAGPTNVGGIISTDTVWRKEDSPFVVTANSLVAPGVTLSVEPGVTVQFSAKYYIQIDGALSAIGTQQDPILFTRSEAFAGYWESITFTDSSVDWNGTTGSIIENAVLEYGGDGVNLGTRSGTIFISGASPLIRGNVIRNGWSNGIRVSGNASPVITGNSVSTQQIDAGILLYALGGSAQPTVEGNIVTRNPAIGVWLEGGSNHTARISGNRMTDNGIGLRIFNCHPGATIRLNTIEVNSTGVSQEHCDTMAGKIEENNILTNCSYNMYLDGGFPTTVDVPAPNNYWGTSDSSAIDLLIFDFFDDFRLGKVLYQPLLSAPVAGGPPPDSVGDANNNGIGDACDPADTDGDGFSDRSEYRIGTSRTLACGFDAWPADINNDGFSDISDIDAVNGVFDQPVPPAPARYDLRPDGFVDISDIDVLNGFFDKSCL